MRYTVDEAVFKINPEIKFGILIGSNIKNSETSAEDEKRLREAEENMRKTVKAEEIRALHNVALYREVMTKAGINPNKFLPSVEAMFKRILKGGELPKINALVDLCNAVSIEQIISLGAHDLSDIHEDLEVCFSKEGDKFIPFGSEEPEMVEEGELVFK
ncbi:MAG TPA: phenylalanine--tRNA ligase beta subunit-related protein, partial [Bacillota bacterium]|nr:phenylalanine--tRNA ligase beta subunit-related protein [Bacillota bacterium]